MRRRRVVLGLLYAISATDEAALDGFEGVDQGNYCKALGPVQRDRETVIALIYIYRCHRCGKTAKAGIHQAYLRRHR